MRNEQIAIYCLLYLADLQKFLNSFVVLNSALLQRSHGTPVTAARRSIPGDLLLDLAGNSSKHSNDTDTSQHLLPA